MDKQIVEQILTYDSSFNEAMFKSYVDNVFVKIYTAVMMDELETVKHFMTQDVYQSFLEKINQLNKQNLRQMYDELNVKSTNIINFQASEDLLVIEVKLISRYLDYFLNKETGDFVAGNNQTRVEKINYLTLTKKRNFLTQSAVRKCPGCGASISVNTNGKCSYCGVTYNLDDYDYILMKIRME